MNLTDKEVNRFRAVVTLYLLFVPLVVRFGKLLQENVLIPKGSLVRIGSQRKWQIATYTNKQEIA